MIGRECLCQVGGKRLGTGKQVVGKLAKLRRKSELAARAHRRMAREHLFDERRSGAREAHDEDRLRHVGVGPWRAAAARSCLDEESPEAPEELLDSFRLIAQSAALGGEFGLALDEITPGFVISTKAIVQSSARELPIAIERRGGLDDRECLRVAAGAGQELRPQQIDIAGGPPLLRAVEQLRGAGEIPAHFVQLRPMTERQEFARDHPVGVGEQDIGFLEPPLVHQVDREICQRRRARASKRQRAPEMPLTCGKVVELREQRTEDVHAQADCGD